ncbi:2-oxo-3-deoxygalactonate kinase [Escherichia coli 2-474-04_S1_C2]|uniref:2-dehydro-3-deoxygalactonokinase n=2 Tax=Escherichia coli TaxID=562 RepID=UPI0004D5A8C2|nr:2-dehydro-3-deoxygalactonokinase [Escherichia coli]KDY99645.1 2-oxo-3-deoxygalactonate kinase [Escherichia coli 2-474-04_S1_C2]
MTSRYIAIDWGSTNLRAWLYQSEKCLESRKSEAGITRLNGRTFEAVLSEITEGWMLENTPVVMAGMGGSNAGWVNVPYLPCPARLNDIGRHLTRVKDNVWIVPGLCINNADNHNVMRGEETQLVGAHTLRPSALYVMPGTHCKWVRVDGDRVEDFRTVMTGELHHVLLTHTLVGTGLPQQTDSPEAFNAGLECGLQSPAILPRLFEVRASYVLGVRPREQVSEFLSGLLIGSEVASMGEYIPVWQTVTLVASPSLTARYQRAFALFGRQSQALSGDDAFQVGIRSIAYAVAK